LSWSILNDPSIDNSISDAELIRAADKLGDQFQMVVRGGRGGRGGRGVGGCTNGTNNGDLVRRPINPYAPLGGPNTAAGKTDDLGEEEDVVMVDELLAKSNKRKDTSQTNEYKEEEEATDSFPGWNLNDQRSRSCRYLLNMSLPPSEDPFSMIQELVCQAWEVMTEVDPEVILYPWGGANPQYPPISDVTTVPIDRVGLKAYINKVVWKIEGGSIHVELWIGHNLPLDKFKQAVEPGLKSLNMTLYTQLSQTKAETVIGWLHSSTQFMDTVKTAEFLSKKVGIKLWLRWTIIYHDR
jgi:hypothetical protein